MIVAAVMTDHPSWLSAGNGAAYRAVRCGTSVWALTCAPAGSGGYGTAACLVSGVGEPQVVDVLDPATLTGENAVVAPLQEAGTVARWRNPDLWDALATSIIRQVIRAGQARKLYRAFCQAHGEPVSTPVGHTWLFPTPEIVLALPDTEFGRLGLAFKCRLLRIAAQAYLEFGQKWVELDPTQLVHEVQTVPRVGPWTAGAAVADLTNDYALYPFSDLAVRTWVKRLAAGRIWPETESEFAHEWLWLAGEQLSEWTLLTLAWGVRHAHGTAL